MDTLQNYTGAVPDPRTEDQKASDYTHHDILGGSSVMWQNKTEWVTLDLRRQSTSSSCGAQSLAKALTAFNTEVMSATPIYHARQNYPTTGMYIQDVGNVGKNKKTNTEKNCPSQDMTEESMNSAPVVFPLDYGISAYYFLPSGKDLNMDLLAQALEQGHALILGVNSNIDEWTDVPVATPTPTTFSHFVCTVSKNYLLYKGERAVVIDDSCNAYSTLGGSGQRILRESFLESRVWGIMALVPAKAEDVQVKPKHAFETDLSFGSKGDDVKALQDALKYEGLMPKEIPSTGYFGTITKASVIKLQEKYRDFILVPAQVSSPTGYVGSWTRMWLNKNYNQ